MGPDAPRNSSKSDTLERFPIPAIVSIHDLMPETILRVREILKWLERRSIPPVTLLVVPGKKWEPQQIDFLRKLAERGHPLAAHGWYHKTKPRNLFHKLHSAFISRDVAEHLDLNSIEIRDLMIRSHDWFLENALPKPDFYVPPAWALGPISDEHLLSTPYSLIETTQAVHILSGKPNGKVSFKLPLTGFEADTHLRAIFLKAWNTVQYTKAQKQKLPLRISIHPNDLDLHLVKQMDFIISQPHKFIDYSALI